MELLEWTSDYSGALTALLTAVLAGATLCYVWLTRRLVLENRELRELATKPQISLSIRPHEGFINIVWLIIENHGGGPAFNLRFDITNRPENEQLSQRLGIGLFEKGLSFLGPHQKLELFLANAIGNLDQLKSAPLVIVVKYSDSVGRDSSAEFVLNFGELEGYTRVGKPPLYEIEDDLKALKDSVERLTSGTRMIKVLAYSPEEFRKEERTNDLWFELHRMSDEERERLLRMARGGFPSKCVQES